MFYFDYMFWLRFSMLLAWFNIVIKFQVSSFISHIHDYTEIV